MECLYCEHYLYCVDLFVFGEYFRFFIPCIFYMCYNKNYQQMRLFVLCLYLFFLVFSLHVSGLRGPIIRGISSCCFYATIWFMQCFVDRLRASADWWRGFRLLGPDCGCTAIYRSLKSHHRHGVTNAELKKERSCASASPYMPLCPI